MRNLSKAALAATLFAAGILGGAPAFAASDGDYYPGASRDSVMADDAFILPPARSGQGVDLFSTQSINRADDGAMPMTNDDSPANGDYYQGAEDPR